MQQRKIRSFVRRGRMRPPQKQAFSELGPLYLLSTAEGQLNFTEVFGREAETFLDIGFGNGESLIAMAQVHPENNYLGVEVYSAGIGALLAKIKEHALNNIRIIQADIIDVLNQNVKSEILSGITLFFPDPWPKKRHHKRRLIQVEFVKLLQEKLKRGAYLHIATDWEHYANHISKVLTQVTDFTLEKTHGERPLTKFALRAERLGHSVWDFYLNKNV